MSSENAQHGQRTLLQDTCPEGHTDVRTREDGAIVCAGCELVYSPFVYQSASRGHEHIILDVTPDAVVQKAAAGRSRTYHILEDGEPKCNNVANKPRRHVRRATLTDDWSLHEACMGIHPSTDSGDGFAQRVAEGEDPQAVFEDLYGGES